MAEQQKEWQNGRMAETATYVLFMVHTDDNDNDGDDDDKDDNDDDNTLIFYITDCDNWNRLFCTTTLAPNVEEGTF